MHYRCEIIMPPVENIEDAIAQIMEPFDENKEDRRQAFWDFYVIGGRWAGQKLIEKYDAEKIKEFEDWLSAEKITVSGVQFGKQELSPSSQIPKVDQKWNELFPSDQFVPCPLFRHSNDQFGKGLNGTLPGDVDCFSEISDRVTCCRVIFAGPDHEGGRLEAKYMLCDEQWNGVNHMSVDWDGKVTTASKKFTDSLKNYREEYANKITPRANWLVVTVDYHS